MVVDEIVDDIAQEKRSRRMLRGKALEALHLALDARGWGQEQLAEHAGLSKATAWKVMKGRSVSIASLQKVARAIDDSRPDRATMRLLTGELDQ